MWQNDDPAETVHVLFDKVQPRAEHGAQDSRALLRKGELILRHEGDERTRFQIEPFDKRADLFRNEFGDSNRGRAVFVQLEPEHCAAFRLDFELFRRLVDPLAGNVHPVDRDRLYDLPLRRAEAAPLHEVGNIPHKERIAEIGLVAAVRFERLAICDAAEGRLVRFPTRIFCKYGGQNAFEYAEHFLLRGERHFDVELIKFAGRTVGAGVLVAETGRDLEVFIESRAHEQLFVLLGRLRQRVKFPGIQAAGHDIVPRAFGRGAR